MNTRIPGQFRTEDEDGDTDPAIERTQAGQPLVTELGVEITTETGETILV